MDELLNYGLIGITGILVFMVVILLLKINRLKKLLRGSEGANIKATTLEE